MTRVALRDLARHAWVWAAVGLVALTVAVFTTWCLSFTVAVSTAPDALFAAAGTDRRGYQQVGGNLLGLTCLPAVVVLGIVLSSVTAHTAEAQSLWRLGGATPQQVVRMLALQTVAVSGLATIGGAALSAPLQPAVNQVLAGLGKGGLRELPTVYSPVALAGAVAVLTLVSVAAVVVPAWRAALRSPTQVRSAPEEATRPGRGYAVGAGVVLVLGVLPLVSIIGVMRMADGVFLTAAVTLPLGQGVVLACALAAPWVLPGLIAVWTRLLAPTSWTSWQLARHLSLARVAGSAATVAPLMLGLGLLASYGMLNDTLAAIAPPGATPNEVEGMVVLVPVAVVSAAGSIAVVMMAGRQHTRDIVAMRSAGATPLGTAGVLALESVIVVGSAVILALVPAAAQYGLLAYALSLHQVSTGHIGFDALPATALAAAALAGMLLALLLAVRSTWRRPLSELLGDR